MTSNPNSHNLLCDTCSGILATICHVDWHTQLVHHDTLQALTDSAKDACGICSVLLEHLQSTAFQHESALWAHLFPILCESDTSAASWQSSFDLVLTSPGVDSLALKFTFLGVESPTGKESGYQPSSTTDSPASQELIVKWLGQCTESHTRCNAPPPESWTPTRLLDISTAQHGFIRLVERKEGLFSNQRYATLSHCWGSNPGSILTTNMTNIAEHYTAIPMTRLSKSFRDGVRIALSLDLRYLWIDSLCILQDSKDDWAQEAEMMSEVYRYGFINIGATGASHGDEGCFWTRDLRAVLPTECFVRWSNSSENARRYQLVPDTDIWAQKFMSEPINQRAWVLQERILSPRMLHFGHEQLFWECRELVACETFPRSLPPSLRQNRLLDIKTLDLSEEPVDSRWPAKYKSSSVSIRTTLLGSAWSYLTEFFRPITVQQLTLKSPVNRSSIYQDWDALVELYSLGALTFSLDKLVAISGLANNISIGEGDAPRDGYLAGLWQSSLPSHLLWMTKKYKRKGKHEELTMVPGRHEEYIAPSWSWASIDGKISFEWCQHNYDLKDYLVELKGADVTWSQQNARFGQVLSGFLNLSGPLASAEWDPTIRNISTSPRTAKITHLFPPSLDSTRAVSVLPNAATEDEIFFDTETDKVPDPIILLPIIGPIRRRAREIETVSGLVLRKANRAQGDFERVGVFITMRERVCKILKNMPVETVTIR